MNRLLPHFYDVSQKLLRPKVHYFSLARLGICLETTEKKGRITFLLSFRGGICCEAVAAFEKPQKHVIALVHIM